MRRTKLYVWLVIASCTVGSIAFFAGKATDLEPVNRGRLPTEEHAAAPRSYNYKQILARLESERLRLASRYQRASSAERTALITEARTILTRSIYDHLFPAWYGTAWDFNGTTEIPQQGKIACGYFISTVLRDAGWKVERVRLAQQASENIILSLTTDPFIKRFRRVAIADFVSAVKEWGPGIYIVGLDNHVGFIMNTGDDVYFIHSSYVDPYMVVKEKAINSQVLAASNYRVLGNILADDLLISNWLAGRTIPTKS